jgi:hypothetical protein
MTRTSSLRLAALCALLLEARVGAAQPEPPPAPPAPAPAGAQVVITVLPAPAAAPVATPVIDPPAPPAAAAAPAAAPERWVDRFQVEGFVDAYAGLNFNFPRSQSGANGFRAYDVTNGAALHWVGLNFSYPASPVGGAVSLRFGPSASLYAGGDASINLTSVKQAFASWKPGGAEGTVTLDFGKYDQPFGSELADSQLNLNYTRSVLYWYAQPLFFTGFRLDWAPVAAFDVKLFAVNGWNNSLDNNSGKSFGVQVMLKPADAFIAYLGYLAGPEQADTQSIFCPAGTAFSAGADACAASPGAAGGAATVAVPGANQRVRHLADVVLDVNPTKDVRLLFNATYGHDQVPVGANPTAGVSFYGANLGARYAFNDTFALAARGEVYWDPDGFSTATGKFTRLVDGTLTLAAAPSEHLQIKLDGRLDYANDAFFVQGSAGASSVQITTTLGVVATTGVLAPFALSR